MNLTRNKISFLKDVHSSIKVDMTSQWRHKFLAGLSVYEISSFIKLIGDDKIYVLIPVLINSKSLTLPTLNLSEPFLVDNKSNPRLITSFILYQWENSGFNLKQDSQITFSFKFKRFWLSEL
jgi:hypothetical protein